MLQTYPFTLSVDKEIQLVTPVVDNANELFNLVDKNRAKLRTWLPWLDRNTSVEDTLQFIKVVRTQFEEEQGVQFCIKYHDTIAGIVGTHVVDHSNKLTSIGYWLGEEFCGKGIMTRSVQALIDFCFSHWHLNRIEIKCATHNTASRAIPERLKFNLEGIARQESWLYDHFVDHAVYSLLASDSI